MGTWTVRRALSYRGLKRVHNSNVMARILRMGIYCSAPTEISKSYAWQKQHTLQLLGDELVDDR